MKAQDFLLEIGCEELPPQALEALSAALLQALEHQLKKADLSFTSSHVYATPRRLAVMIHDVIVQQPPRSIERQGPNVKAAFDKSGTPTLACLGFARSAGVSTDQLKIKELSNGSFVFCTIEQSGKRTLELLPDIIEAAIKQLPLSKPMRWGDGDISFIRPVHWVLALFGHDNIDAMILGKQTTKETRGHRFHHPKPLVINQPKDYPSILMTQGMVIADFGKRREKIRELVVKAALSLGNVILDEGLLSEIASVVEWPTALLGEFKKEFLDLPQEVLITTLKVHQRCFSVKSKTGSLLPYFVLVSNIESKDPKQVIEGNERVINARLTDAAFFYRNDLRLSLESRLDKLTGVLFQHDLGTIYEKSLRLEKLTAAIMTSIEPSSKLGARAGKLAKCDLVSAMVYEFPSLQGIMGYYYALHDKEPLAIAEAIREHYLPKFSGDVLPNSSLGAALALADRLDTLIGIFGIHKAPRSDKDPFALRRAALGVLRILIEKKLPLDLLFLLHEAEKNYSVNLPNKEVVAHVFEFMMERLRAFYSDKGVDSSIISAVLAVKPTTPLDFDRRLTAVQFFKMLPEAEALAIANKRVGNILKKQPEALLGHSIDSELFESDAEHHLAALIDQQSKKFNALYEKASYTEALSELALLKNPVDQFFNDVMVMVDDQKKCANRLALLSSLHHLFTKVADISLL